MGFPHSLTSFHGGQGRLWCSCSCCAATKQFHPAGESCAQARGTADIPFGIEYGQSGHGIGAYKPWEAVDQVSAVMRGDIYGVKKGIQARRLSLSARLPRRRIAPYGFAPPLWFCALCGFAAPCVPMGLPAPCGSPPPFGLPPSGFAPPQWFSPLCFCPLRFCHPPLVLPPPKIHFRLL